jgi:hypothetical protein
MANEIYNTSNLNFTDMYTITKTANDVTPGAIMMPLMLAVIWIVSLIGSISEGRQFSRAFIFASFVSALISIPMALIGMLNPSYMYFLFLMVAGGVLWDKLQNSPGM